MVIMMCTIRKLYLVFQRAEGKNVVWVEVSEDTSPDRPSESIKKKQSGPGRPRKTQPENVEVGDSESPVMKTLFDLLQTTETETDSSQVSCNCNDI